MQRICEEEGCRIRPSYGKEWKKPTHCSKHKKEDMENVVDKRCQEEGCKIQPSYGKELKKPTHCYKHASEDMVNVKSRKCAEKDCTRIPTYGFEKNKPIYCARHAKKEMINCRSNTCEEEGCTKVPSFGYNKPIHCKQHRKEDMKYLKHNSKQDLPETAKSCKFKNETASKNNLDTVKTSMPGTATYSVRYERSFASYDGLVPGINIKKVDCWDNKKNGVVLPSDVYTCSHKKYWFNCPVCEHSFESSLGHITSKTEPKWCPYCVNQKLCEDKDCSYCRKKSFDIFEDLAPGTEIQKRDCWDIERNNVTPRDVFKNTRKKYWFNCPICEHSFNKNLNNITSKKEPQWCPYCINRKLCEEIDCLYCYNNSFASYDGLIPGTEIKKVDCWDTERNGTTIRNVFKNTPKKYWFKCPVCNHNFESSLGFITSKRSPGWCPYCCFGQDLCEDKDCSHCYNNSFASYDGLVPGTEIKKVDCWDTEKNNSVVPRQVTKSSGKKYWFNCPTCEHNFENDLCHITSKKSPHWCPYCVNQKLCEDKDCLYCYNNSFASYEEVVPGTEIKKKNCWDTELNDGIKPGDVFKSANKKYWFKCPICEHNFDSTIGHITYSKNPSWCPYCDNKKMCKNKDCSYCYNNSFASYEEVLPGTVVKKKDCWDTERNSIIPRDVFKGTHNKYWFKCPICKHNFERELNNITSKKEPQWCPYCSITKRKFCEDIDCSHCYNNSFASYDGIVPGTEIKKVDCWDTEKNNSVVPRQVTKSSGKKYWFNCPICELSFESSLGHITSKTRSRWCPHCRRKTERKLYKFLINLYGESKIKKEKNFKWLKSKKKFDFLIIFKEIIVELDGNQHFFQVQNWKSPEEQLENDNDKTKLALENGYTVIRLYQPDVLFDKNNWEEKFSTALEEVYSEPTQVCIGPDGIYKDHL
jgi:very-short-patch-repair endonuclease